MSEESITVSTQAPQAPQAPSAPTVEVTPGAAPRLQSASARAAETIAALGLDRSAPFKALDNLGTTRSAENHTGSVDNSEPVGESDYSEDAEQLSFTAPEPEPEQASAADRFELRRQTRLMQTRDRQLQDQTRQLREQQAAFQTQQAQYQQVMAAAQQLESDPDALLRAAGITDQEQIQRYRRQVIDRVIRDHAPVDPLEEKVQAALAPRLEALQAEQARVEQLHQSFQKNQILNQQVFPVLQNTERYETLLGIHNGDIVAAANQVFETAHQNYQASGAVLSFEQIAQALDDQYSEALNLSINTVRGMKRYAGMFQGEANPKSNIAPNSATVKSAVAGDPSTQAKAKKPATTLTNQNAASYQTGQVQAGARSNANYESDRKAETLRRLGFDPSGKKASAGKVSF